MSANVSAPVEADLDVLIVGAGLSGVGAFLQRGMREVWLFDLTLIGDQLAATVGAHKAACLTALCIFYVDKLTAPVLSIDNARPTTRGHEDTGLPCPDVHQLGHIRGRFNFFLSFDRGALPCQASSL